MKLRVLRPGLIEDLVSFILTFEHIFLSSAWLSLFLCAHQGHLSHLAAGKPTTNIHKPNQLPESNHRTKTNQNQPTNPPTLHPPNAPNQSECPASDRLRWEFAGHPSPTRLSSSFPRLNPQRSGSQGVETRMFYLPWYSRRFALRNRFP